MKEKQDEPTFVKFFDKCAWTLGVLNLLVCQYFLVNVPAYYWVWYSFIVPILAASRFYVFKSLSWQYFLLDFCYFAIGCSMVNLFLVVNSPLFFKVKKIQI